MVKSIYIIQNCYYIMSSVYEKSGSLKDATCTLLINFQEELMQMLLRKLPCDVI